MKKTIALIWLFALSLLMAACDNDEHLPEISLLPPPPSPQDHVENTFSLEQLPEEFLKALANEEIQQVLSDKPDGRFVDFEGFFTYRTIDNEISAAFTENNQLVSLGVQTPKYATERGLRIGNNEERLFELYGNDLQRGKYNPLWFYLIEGDVGMGFSLGIVDGAIGVVAWSIFEPTLHDKMTEAAINREG